MNLSSPNVGEPIPARLGRYTVRAKIGEGGMATVYLGHSAQSPGDARPEVVALKVIKDEFSLNREFVNMFMDEAKIVSRLSHPNIVQIYELGNEGMRLFIAMRPAMPNPYEYVRCKKVCPLPISTASSTMR